MISIVIPTFNRSDSVLVAINSILSRYKQNIEIVIIDDASQDDTEKKIKSLNHQSITYIRNNTNIGTALSKLRGIKVASGNYIGFLDDDDIWVSDPINFANDTNTNCDLILYDFKIKYIDDSTSTLCSLQAYKKNFQNNVAKNMGNIFMQSCLFKKEFILLYIDRLDSKATPSEDWDFFISISQEKPTIHYQKKVIFQWNLHKNSQSYNVKNETVALQYIIKKHCLFFQQYPELLSRHYRIIGNRLYYEKQYDMGDKYIQRAFFTYPYKLKNLILKFLTVFPVQYRRWLINYYFKKIL